MTAFSYGLYPPSLLLSLVLPAVKSSLLRRLHSARGLTFFVWRESQAFEDIVVRVQVFDSDGRWSKADPIGEAAVSLIDTPDEAKVDLYLSREPPDLEDPQLLQEAWRLLEIRAMSDRTATAALKVHTAVLSLLK